MEGGSIAIAIATSIASSAHQQEDGSGSRVSLPRSPSSPSTAHPAPPPGASNHMKISDKHECWVVFVHLESFTMSNDPSRHLTQLGKDG